MFAEPLRRDLVGGLGGGLRRLLSRRPEQRQVHVAVLVEDDLHQLPDLELVGVAVNDVGGQPNPRVLDDRDLSHHVRRRQARQAEPVVDGEAGERRVAGDLAHAHLVRAAVPAYRLRGMDQRAAMSAFLQPQRAVGTRGPEEFGLVGDGRQRTA